MTLNTSLTQVQQLSKKEIEDLLRKGAYGALMDEEDEGSKFCEEDIDQILLRRTHTITIESEGKGSTFAKVRTHPGVRSSGEAERRLCNALVRSTRNSRLMLHVKKLVI